MKRKVTAKTAANTAQRAGSEDAAGIPFTEEEKDEFDTLNGFLISKADRIPADGEHFTVQDHGYEFRVLNVQNKMIRSVKVSWTGEEPGEEEAH